MNSNKITFFVLIWLLIGVVSCYNKKPLVPDSKERAKMAAKVDSFEILRPSILVYGMGNAKDRQRQIVDAWYKFRFKIIAGDNVTDSLVKAANEHNRKTDSILTIRIGRDWRYKFESAVDSLYSTDSLAIEIAKTDKFILNFDTTTEKHHDELNYYPNLTYTCHPTTEAYTKMVVVEGYGVVYGRVGWVSYLRAKVDMKKHKVVSIDKTQYGTE